MHWTPVEICSSILREKRVLKNSVRFQWAHLALIREMQFFWLFLCAVGMEIV